MGGLVIYTDEVAGSSPVPPTKFVHIVSTNPPS